MKRFVLRLSVFALAACGKLAGNDGPPDTGAWGVACKDASALATPPACDPNADAGDICQAWADSIVPGAVSICYNSQCMVSAGTTTCTPGPDGDAQCQAYFQKFSKSRVRGTCWPHEPNDPGAVGNQCVSADKCVVTSNNTSHCTCGSQELCGSGSLCLDNGGAPACGAWCQ